MQVRIPALLAGAAAVAVLSGCDDATALPAQFENRLTTATVFAFSGTPATLPSGLMLRSRLPVRLDATFAFDIAFDINDAGEVVVYTQRRIANELVPTHPVGLIVSDDPFADVTRAPVEGFYYDSLVVLPAGKTLLVDNLERTCDQFSILGQNIRGKISVDSVNLAERAIHLKMIVNQNCGFRVLTPGLPPE